MTKKTQKKRKIKKVELKNLNFKSLIDTTKQKIIDYKNNTKEINHEIYRL